MGQNQLKNPTLSENQKKKLDEGKPVFLFDGIKITKNPKTGKLQGVPQQWVKNYQLPLDVDQTKLVSTKKLPENIRADQQLPQSIVQLINSQPIQISWPTDFKHKIHVTHDMNLKDLPKQWALKINQSMVISEQLSNQASSSMISDFQEDLRQSQIQSHILTTKQFQDVVEKVKFIQEYPGKGAMCKVFFAYDKAHQNRQYYACRIIKMKDKKTLKKLEIKLQLCHY